MPPIISATCLTIITSISYDHMEILGSTLTEIAGEGGHFEIRRAGHL